MSDPTESMRQYFEPDGSPRNMSTTPTQNQPDPRAPMKLSKWLRGPVPERDPVIRRLTYIALACIVALALWPIITLILVAHGVLP